MLQGNPNPGARDHRGPGGGGGGGGGEEEGGEGGDLGPG